MGIGGGDGVGSESGFACAEIFVVVVVDDDDDFGVLGGGFVGLESVMARGKKVIVFGAGWILVGVRAVTQNDDLDCADVLVYVHLSYPHDASEKAMTFGNDAQAFPHRLSNPDVGVWGLDFRRKILELYVADSGRGFLSDTVRAVWSWIDGARDLSPRCALYLLHSYVRVSGRT